MYRCESDLWDNYNGAPYLGAEDFLKMCREVFGETPRLRAERCPEGTRYVDADSGDTILTPLLGSEPKSGE